MNNMESCTKLCKKFRKNVQKYEKELKKKKKLKKLEDKAEYKDIIEICKNKSLNEGKYYVSFTGEKPSEYLIKKLKKKGLHVYNYNGSEPVSWSINWY
jgi:hypothetical protein